MREPPGYFPNTGSTCARYPKKAKEFQDSLEMWASSFASRRRPWSQLDVDIVTGIGAFFDPLERPKKGTDELPNDFGADWGISLNYSSARTREDKYMPPRSPTSYRNRGNHGRDYYHCSSFFYSHGSDFFINFSGKFHDDVSEVWGNAIVGNVFESFYVRQSVQSQRWWLLRHRRTDYVKTCALIIFLGEGGVDHSPPPSATDGEASNPGQRLRRRGPRSQDAVFRRWSKFLDRESNQKVEAASLASENFEVLHVNI